MNKYQAVAVLLGAVLSCSVFAAKEITPQDVQKMKLEKIGSVHTTAETTSPMDAKHELSKLADEKGGKYYVVVAGREHGRFSAIADVYK